MAALDSTKTVCEIFKSPTARAREKARKNVKIQNSKSVTYPRGKELEWKLSKKQISTKRTKIFQVESSADCHQMQKNLTIKGKYKYTVSVFCLLLCVFGFFVF